LLRGQLQGGRVAVQATEHLKAVCAYTAKSTKAPQSLAFDVPAAPYPAVAHQARLC
jgi:hypothetical protein